jgi:hypothetical protein
LTTWVSLPFLFSATIVYLPESFRLALTMLNLVWYSTFSTVMHSELPRGMPSRQNQVTVGAGSPLTSASHVWFLPTLIVASCSVSLSMYGLTAGR